MYVESKVNRLATANDAADGARCLAVDFILSNKIYDSICVHQIALAAIM